MKTAAYMFAAIALFPVVGTAGKPDQAVLVDVKRIGDTAPHSAFTDLVRFRDQWFCVFREGKDHVSPDGALRVLTSTDGETWTSAALLTSETSDLRDAKITVTPNNQLMLAGAEAISLKDGKQHQSLAWFSDDGKVWSQAYKMGDVDNWLWRVTWNKEQALGFGYGCLKEDRRLTLYQSKDGKTFDRLIEDVEVDSTYPNESSIVFAKDDAAYCLLRHDGTPKSGTIGIAHPPYTDWTWKKLGIRVGGPHMIQLPDGRFVAVVRLYGSDDRRTSVCWVDPEKGSLTETLELPSGGDTSYAGLVWHEDMLWVSYYSTHEEKTCIYLARVRFK